MVLNKLDKLISLLSGKKESGKPKPNQNKPSGGTTIVGNGKPPNDPCKLIENGVPGTGYRGGKHGAISKSGKSYTPNRESHHIPAADAHGMAGTLKAFNAPSIQMDIDDHQKTASWGNSTSAKAYRNRQAQLLKRGKIGFMAAMSMDITDIKTKFGNKYDIAIAQMLALAKSKGYI